MRYEDIVAVIAIRSIQYTSFIVADESRGCLPEYAHTDWIIRITRNSQNKAITGFDFNILKPYIFSPDKIPIARV
jgi:hypothetical protein